MRKYNGVRNCAEMRGVVQYGITNTQWRMQDNSVQLHCKEWLIQQWIIRAANGWKGGGVVWWWKRPAINFSFGLNPIFFADCRGRHCTVHCRHGRD